MKFTLSWLKDHLETDADAHTIAERLTLLGLEVEGIEDRARELAPFTVAHVLEAKPHPNADRLRVCQVDTGQEVVQVVCGAPNARTGMKGVFAAAGSYIPGTDMVLKAGAIRGEASNGMLLSERETGLSDEHEGIIDLDPEAPLGAPMAEVMGLDDAVIDVAITPNRADCLGVRGIARDLAAAGLGTLKPADVSPVQGTFESPVKWLRDLPGELSPACPFVVGRFFRGVKNGPSPEWMQRRLTAIGLRPISALVDITNYVTYDLCRPLHVFDADKLAGDLTMRMATEGEEILALDGETYRLDPSMVVIADGNGPQGIGGVMGGELTGCTAETTNVFLEVALFDPVRTAATGRQLGILSDARFRFERGLDPNSALWGAEVAARLIVEICGGEASEVVSAGALPAVEREIAFRPERVRSLGGVEVASDRQAAILKDLGFAVEQAQETFTVAVPSWRGDVEGEACLVEEVLRVQGYDTIPPIALPRESELPEPVLTLTQRRESRARRALAWRGLDEVVTFSFISSDLAGAFGGADPSLRLINPISSDLDVMRPSILPGLAAAAARNADRGFADTALFEVGPQYADASPEGQSLVAAGLRAGRPLPAHWQEKSRPLDAFDAKADAMAVLVALGAPTNNLQIDQEAPPACYHPGRYGALRLGPKVLARFGELHPRVLRALDLRGPAVAFEVFLEALPEPKAKDGSLRPALHLSPFQPLRRDFAFVIDESVAAEKLVRAAKGADKALIAEVELFDLYVGEALGPGKKSLAITVTLQPTEKTLTDEEIAAVSQKIVAKVEKATGGVLRT